MLEKYHKFDTAKMLREYAENQKTLELNKDRLKYLDGTSAVDYDGDKVTGSTNVDGIVNLALERISLESDILRQENDLNFVDACLKLIPTDELVVLQAFFMSGKTPAEALDILTKTLHLEKSVIYDIRKMGLERLTRYIAGVNAEYI